MAPSTRRHSPRKLLTTMSNGYSLAIRPPNGHWRWLKSARPKSPPHPTASRATSYSSRTPTVQRS
jgi:hypothetical protein